jgi:predicted membrane protein
MFNVFPSIFTIMFLLFAAMFIFVAIRGIANTVRNVSSPVITVEAKVIGKRMDVSTHVNSSNDNGISNSSSSTTYYITFQTEHGERMELSLSGRVYGLLVEGDYGRLTYQGTWFKDFQRN